MLITMAERCIGSSHIKQNKHLQDYAAATSDRLRSYAYALVADGHGGDKYIRSAKGSELAVRCAVDSINGVLKEILWDVTKKKQNLIEKNLKLICIKTSLSWKDAVIADYKANPLKEEEKQFCETLNLEVPATDDDIPVLYGSTLLAAVYLEHLNFWFTIQIGDGKCAVIKNDLSATLLYFRKGLDPLREALHDKKGLSVATATTIFGPFVGVGFSLMAVQYTAAGIASTLMAMTPIIILLPSYWLFKQKITWRAVLGAIISVFGVSLFFLG